MTAFRIFLGAYLTVLVVYTVIVGMNHGWNLIPVFFGDMMALTWPGQFNLDFLGFLCLSALWVSWRHEYTPAGLALAVVAFFGGVVFLATYLLYATGQANGDMKALLLGPGRANA